MTELAQNIEDHSNGELHTLVELLIEDRFKKAMSRVEERIKELFDELSEPLESETLAERIEVSPFLSLTVEGRLPLDLRKSAIIGVCEKVKFNNFRPAGEAPSCTVMTIHGSHEVLETREEVLEALGQGEL